MKSAFPLRMSFINWRKIPWYLWSGTKVTTLNLIQTNGIYYLVKWDINMLSKLEIKLSQTVENKNS